LLRKIVAALVLVPLAIVIIALAVANREPVTVSLDPFNSKPPAASLTLPLFGLMIGLLAVGVVAGGAAAWLRQSKWRRSARRLEREASRLRSEVASLRPTARAANSSSEATAPPLLKLRPPVR
jgi:uncharacterized integral membrane protein